MITGYLRSAALAPVAQDGEIFSIDSVSYTVTLTLPVFVQLYLHRPSLGPVNKCGHVSSPLFRQGAWCILPFESFTNDLASLVSFDRYISA